MRSNNRITGAQGLTEERRALLGWLAEHPRATLSDAARVFGTGRNAMHYRAKGLEILGLVEHESESIGMFGYTRCRYRVTEAGHAAIAASSVPVDVRAATARFVARMLAAIHGSARSAA